MLGKRSTLLATLLLLLLLLTADVPTPACAAASLRVALLSDERYDPWYGTARAFNAAACGPSAAATAAEASPASAASGPMMALGSAGCDAPMGLVQATANDVAALRPQYLLYAGGWARSRYAEAYANSSAAGPASSATITADVFEPMSAVFAQIVAAATAAEGSLAAAAAAAVSPRWTQTVDGTDVVPADDFNTTAAADSGTLVDQARCMQGRQLLPADAVTSFGRCGFYAESAAEGLRVVSLNTLLWTWRWQGSGEGAGDSSADPCGQLAFLRAALAEARAAGQQVIVLGSVPPTADVDAIRRRNAFSDERADMYWRPAAAAAYRALIAASADVVMLQVFGHTGAFAVVADASLGVPMLLASAVSPWRRTAPAYFWLHLDNTTGRWRAAEATQRWMTLSSGMWETGRSLRADLGLDLSDPRALYGRIAEMRLNASLWGAYEEMRNGGTFTPNGGGNAANPPQRCTTDFCRYVTVAAMLFTDYADIKRYTVLEAPPPLSSTTTTTSTQSPASSSSSSSSFASSASSSSAASQSSEGESESSSSSFFFSSSSSLNDDGTDSPAITTTTTTSPAPSDSADSANNAASSSLSSSSSSSADSSSSSSSSSADMDTSPPTTDPTPPVTSPTPTPTTTTTTPIPSSDGNSSNVAQLPEVFLRIPQVHLAVGRSLTGQPSGAYRDAATGAAAVYAACSPLDGGSSLAAPSWCYFGSRDYVTWGAVPGAGATALGSGQQWCTAGGVGGGVMVAGGGTAGGGAARAFSSPATALYSCRDAWGAVGLCVASPAVVSGRVSLAALQPDAANRVFSFGTTWAAGAGVMPATDADTGALGGVTEPWRSAGEGTRATQWLVGVAAQLKTSPESSSTAAVAAVLALRTPDPSWRSGFAYSHVFYSSPTLTAVSGPDFFVVEDSARLGVPGTPHFLKLSVESWRRDWVLYGNYSSDEGGTFVASDAAALSPTVLDYGMFRLGRSAWDPVLRQRLLWGTIEEELPPTLARRQRQRVGVLGLPRRLACDAATGVLRSYPLPETRALRQRLLFANASVRLGGAEADYAVPLPDAPAHAALEVQVTFSLSARVAALFAPPLSGGAEAEKGGDAAPQLGLRLATAARESPAQDDAGTTLLAVAFAMPQSESPVSPPSNLTSLSAPFDPVAALENFGGSEDDCAAACHAHRSCEWWNLQGGACVLYPGATAAANATALAAAGLRPLTTVPYLTLQRPSSASSLYSGGSSPGATLGGRAPLSSAVGSGTGSGSGRSKVTLSVWVDGDVVEVFKDYGEQSVSGHAYPSALPSGGTPILQLFTRNLPPASGGGGGTDEVTAKVEVFALSSIWREGRQQR